MTLKIRSMTLAEVQIALNWAAQEGWNPGLYDAEPFSKADPDGFLLAELDEQPIGCISVVRYSQKFGFIGLYIVQPEWRGKGYGLKLWQTAWQQFVSRLDADASIGLDGVLAREATYRQAGFVPAYRHIRHLHQPDGSAQHPDWVIPLNQLPLAEILRYDAELFPASRSHFLESWLQMPESAAYGVVEQNRLVGYGVIRRCVQGFKVCPLFADSLEIAEAILQALIVKAGTEPVFIDIPDVHPALPSLKQRYALEPMFTCVRMYWGQVPTLPVDRIFGATTLELG
ncbi:MULTISPECIES: GNAT family N-acetyltransferase [Leptolyngbya]|uniref:GNAT family N-acetyltransferase n=1 Tax=Leptolyngbya TaxID=47251 RepID=UPI001683CFAE|nr:GNAT family N-acetyltransferase [Leptolyngbya sp. FACHB-1624]MBD1858218.1 GNAT family N-acetyltransferase [Leptolyngbya sp. FACHB-1624]